MKRAKKRIIVPPGDEGPTIEEMPYFEDLDKIHAPRRCVTQKRETVSSADKDSEKQHGSSCESSDSSDTKS